MRDDNLPGCVVDASVRPDEIAVDALPSLAELQARNLPRCCFDSLFEGSTTDAGLAEINAYLGAFLPPDRWCPRCKTQLTGSVLGLLDSFRWGLAHGEGCCSRCNYPARAYHQIPNVGRLVMVLAYHPGELAERTSASAEGGGA